MEVKYSYILNIEQGVGKIQGRKQFESDCRQLGNAKMLMTMKRYKAKRSPQQNRLMHMYFSIIADETGNDINRVKDILKKTFLTTELKDDNGNVVCNPTTGETLTYVRETSDLDKEEMYFFTENIRLFAMDFNIHLPLPEEQIKIKI